MDQIFFSQILCPEIASSVMVFANLLTFLNLTKHHCRNRLFLLRPCVLKPTKKVHLYVLKNTLLYPAIQY